MLAAMGAGVDAGAGRIRVRPLSGELAPLSMRVPGDVSAAAVWLALGACHPDAQITVRAVNVNPTRTGILDALRMMGADISLEEERSWGPEPVADITVRSSRLRNAVIEGDLVPRADIEELPDGLRVRPVPALEGAAVSSHGDHRLAMLLGAAGLLARGRTTVRNAGAVAVSYPRFWQDLDMLSRRGQG
jgi:3-phosphoshikimate 1-carboxyvinyltransferase